MSNEIATFNFDNAALRVIELDGEPWFVASDVCAVLDVQNVSQAVSRLDDDERAMLNIGRQGEASIINESGLYSLILGSRKPEAKKFKKWVTSEVLPTIRKTGSYTPHEAAVAKQTVIEPAKEFRSLYGIARLIGLDRNVAAISANQATRRITGTNFLALLGHGHLANEEQKLYYTPTEIGQRLGGISGRKVNMLLAEAGLQAKHTDKWVPLQPAEGMFRVLDTGKAHSDGTMVQQIKWTNDVLDLIHKPKELTKDES